MGMSRSRDLSEPIRMVKKLRSVNDAENNVYRIGYQFVNCNFFAKTFISNL